MQRVRHDFGTKQQCRFAKALAVKLCSDRSELRTFSCMFPHAISRNVTGAPIPRAYSHNGAWTGSELPSSRRTEAALERARVLRAFLRNPALLQFLSWIFSLPQHRPCFVPDLRPILNGGRKHLSTLTILRTSLLCCLETSWCPFSYCEVFLWYFKSHISNLTWTLWSL